MIPSAPDMSALLQNPLANFAAAGARIPPFPFDPHGQARLLAAGLSGVAQTNGTPAYSFKYTNGLAQPVNFPDDAFNAPGIPRYVDVD